MATLARLNSIDLNENKIKNIPDGVDGLQITELSLNQNQISSISPGMYSDPILNSQFCNDCLYLIVWTFHDFSVTQILREIIFGESRISKIAVFAILGALKMIFWYIAALLKCTNSKNDNSEPLNVLKWKILHF